jgi:three-Cys-motif partner protein
MTNRNRAQFERYRAWQWIKHLALADYVVPWAMKLGSTSTIIYVVDLFAGAGTYLDLLTGEKQDGSPVIFARLAKRYAEQRPGRSLRVICCERDRKNHAALVERLKGFGAIVTVLRGGFADHVNRILTAIRDSPSLILFDPIGLKPISAETIKPLLHRKGKTDVFMVLHFKVLHRTAGQLLDTGFGDPSIDGAEETARTFDAVFGTPRWRMIAKSPRYRTAEDRERAFVDLYFEEVLAGRFDYLCAYSVRARFAAKTQYWLVHASGHLDAHLLMNDEIVKLEDTLFRRTYGTDAMPDVIEHEISARHEQADADLRTRALEALSAATGHTMTFGELRDALVPEFFGRVKQGAYSRVVKTLVNDNLVAREARAAAKLEPSERLSLRTSTPEANTIASAA